MSRGVASHQSWQVGATQYAPPQHQVIAACYLAAAQGIRWAPYFTVGDNRQVCDLPGAGDLVPVRRWPVAVALGAGMHRQFGNPRGVYAAHDIQKKALILIAQPGFYCDRYMCRNGGAHRRGNSVHPLGLAQDD